MNCFMCHEPLTSDDYKLDKVVISGETHTHQKCADREIDELEALGEFYCLDTKVVN